MGKKWKLWPTIFLGSKITADGDWSHEIKTLAPWQNSYDKLRIFKKERHQFANKGLFSQCYAFSSSHVLMWELDNQKGWVPKHWFFQIVTLDKTLESPWDFKEIKPVNPKGSQPWIFFGRTDAEAESLILWPHDAKNQLTGKDPDAGKDWGQEEKGVTEDEMDGWMTSLTQWTWAWANSGRWWRTGKPGMLQFMDHRVVYDLVTKEI